jgi:hypothetical protein
MKRTAFFLLLSVFIVYSVKGQIICWEPAGLTGFGPSPWPVSYADINLSAGGLTRGVGVTTAGSAAANGWGGTGFNYSTSAAGITANAFVTFTIEANDGYLVSLSSLDLNYRRSSSGPPSALVQYQTGTGPYTDIGTIAFPSSSSGGGSIPQISLTAFPDLQNAGHGTPVTIRIVPYGASAPSGTWYVFSVTNPSGYDLKMNGTVVPANLAVTYTWAGNDGANWTTASNWIPARLVPAETDILLFNSGGSRSIQMVPGETVGQMIVSGNTALALTPSGPNTLVIKGGSGDDLVVGTGSQLTQLTGNPLSLTCAPSTTSVINGTMVLGGNLTLEPGSNFRINPGGIVSIDGNILINSCESAYIK